MKNSLLAARPVLALLCLAGLGVGLLVGLIVGWIVWPRQVTGASFADLAPEYKDDYIVLVGAGYTEDGALDKARTRLERLQVPNLSNRVADLADTFIHEGRDPGDVQCLVKLADGLGVADSSMLAYVATATPPPTDTPLPTPTFTPLPPTATDEPTAEPPTATEAPPPPTNTSPPEPTATPKPKATAAPTKKPTAVPQQPTPVPTKKPAAAGVDFRVKEARLFTYDEGGCCAQGLIVVKVLDADGTPLDNVVVRFIWSHNAGTPDFVTGEKGPGQVELNLNGGGEQVTVLGHTDGRAFKSEVTRDLRFRSPGPSRSELVAADCCGDSSTGRRMQWDQCNSDPPFDCGGHWNYLVVFQATHRVRP